MKTSKAWDYTPKKKKKSVSKEMILRIPEQEIRIELLDWDMIADVERMEQLRQDLETTYEDPLSFLMDQGWLYDEDGCIVGMTVIFVEDDSGT